MSADHELLMLVKEVLIKDFDLSVFSYSKDCRVCSGAKYRSDWNLYGRDGTHFMSVEVGDLDYKKVVWYENHPLRPYFLWHFNRDLTINKKLQLQELSNRPLEISGVKYGYTRPDDRIFTFKCDWEDYRRLNYSPGVKVHFLQDSSNVFCEIIPGSAARNNKFRSLKWPFFVKMIMPKSIPLFKMQCVECFWDNGRLFLKYPEFKEERIQLQLIEGGKK